MLKAILFDMDGVLIDSYRAWYIVFNKSLEHFGGKPVSEEEFSEKVWAKNFNETAKNYFSVSTAKIREYFDGIYPLFKENLVCFPDVERALEKLKNQKLKLAVVTNTHCGHARRILKDMDLLKFFDYIVGADKVKNGKPEPDLILKALEDMKLKKDEVIFVGDTVWDRIAAKKARVKFIGIRTSGDERIETLAELIRVVK